MSIKDYLKTLDKEQLENTITIAKSMIDKINDEEKKTVWSITTNHMSIEHFHEHEYIKAAEKLLEYAKKITAQISDIQKIMNYNWLLIEYLNHYMIDISTNRFYSTFLKTEMMQIPQLICIIF